MSYLERRRLNPESRKFMPEPIYLVPESRKFMPELNYLYPEMI